jgi:uncharacterized protein YcnI
MRLTILTIAVAAVALAVASVAAAHVTVNPNRVAAGSFARFAIRVPNERPNASTVRVSVQLPLGLAFVAFQPKTGWKRTVTMEKLAKPLKMFGETISERIATVTWTSAGARIGPGEFDEFGMTAAVPSKRGVQLVFPAVQRYSSGETVRWIGPPESEAPAPRVLLTAKAS